MDGRPEARQAWLLRFFENLPMLGVVLVFGWLMVQEFPRQGRENQAQLRDDMLHLRDSHNRQADELKRIKEIVVRLEATMSKPRGLDRLP